MKRLKHIRILLALLCGGECLALAMLGASAPLHARLAGDVQLTSTTFAASLGGSLGACAIWLVATLLLGRVYCASFCPVGVAVDAAGWLRRRLRRRPERRVKDQGKPLRWWVLAAYAAAIVAGAGIVPLLVEPWPAFVNVVEQARGAASSPHAMAASLGVGAAWGIICAVASVALLLLYALLARRSFCNDICPVGSLLALAAPYAVMHIELLPDRCTACLRCEDACPAGAIDIASRRVDNALCVRCFNCLEACPDEAIKFTPNPGGILTPMMRRTPDTSR